ncbi:alkaline phosphatase family protein [Nocardioides sp.]|uniref:alkaline phosphatase family protein n=1 Tax=Nocardioides sp. TaxID=35761 RepID=UPI002728687A|nr:alkaline phosphatase family protein [Nocardioides sp.]MDO9457002.1 alkaline phosphatase family protein [Nocardioides sp.]
MSRRSTLAARQITRFRPSVAWLRGVLRSFLVSFLALALTLWLVPGQQVPEDGTVSVASLVVVVLLVGALLRPLLTRLTVITGVFGLLLTGFLAQSLVLGVALALVPSIEPIDFPEIVVVAWLVAVVAAVLNWTVDASSEEVHLGQVLGRAVRTARRTDVSGPGLLVVQLDGVAEPLLRQAAASGAIPFLTRTLRSGSHRLRGWHTGVPSTTPAGQAVLLHGAELAIPAFRWYDKTRGRVLQCSRPADAAEAEADLSDGRGLLADGGASVANLFSGDAPLRALTMSHARLPGSEPGAAQFAASRSGFVRSVVLFAGQIVAEWYQGRRQRYRDVLPRVHRGGSFVFLRGLTTVVLKDLSVAIVAEQMARGVPVVYVDFVDYDEVAHHAGPTRPETMRTLESLDRVLQFFAELAGEVGRDYEIAVVSDHGQTQGSTYLQLSGRSLADAVRDIVECEVDAGGESAEVMGPANLLTASGAAQPVRRLIDRRTRQADAPQDGQAAVQVVASGSIAHLYLPDRPGRLTREDVDAALPTLLPGLRDLEHVGVVLTRRADGAVVVENAHGHRVLSAAGELDGEGADPLAPYGDGAAADLLLLDTRRHVGDVVVLGRYDPSLGEVAAFEELVGSHGGLGGWQTEALLVHPAGWSVPDGPLTGLDVHRLLVGRLVELGLRRSEPVTSDELVGSGR